MSSCATGSGMLDATADRGSRRSGVTTVRAMPCMHRQPPATGTSSDPRTVDLVYASLRRHPVPITPRKLWPSGSGRKGSISGVAIDWAVTLIDGGVWPDVVDEGFGPDAPLSDGLRGAFTQLLARWRREDRRSRRWCRSPAPATPFVCTSWPNSPQSTLVFRGGCGSSAVLCATTCTGGPRSGP